MRKQFAIWIRDEVVVAQLKAAAAAARLPLGEFTATVLRAHFNAKQAQLLADPPPQPTGRAWKVDTVSTRIGPPPRPPRTNVTLARWSRRARALAASASPGLCWRVGCQHAKDLHVTTASEHLRCSYGGCACTRYLPPPA